MTFDEDLNLVVCEFSNHRLQIVRYADGFFLRTIGSYGSGEGQMCQPWTSAVVGDGNVVVVEYGNHRVQVLRCGRPSQRRKLLQPTFPSRYRDGVHQRTFGGRGSDPGQFIHPTGAPAAPLRFVGATINHRAGIALDGDGGCIIVFDSGNSRIQVLQYNNGRHVRSHGSRGALPGQFRGIGSISFDRERENLVVSDGGNHRVQVLR